MQITLATTCHDPQGRMVGQIAQALPLLRKLFTQIVVQTSVVTPVQVLAELAAAGAVIQYDDGTQPGGVANLGKVRRQVVALALAQNTPFLLFFDLDRLLHWAIRYPDESAATLPQLVDYDMTVIGRTDRAFASHPRCQRETEQLINQLFAQVSGYAWDVMQSGRGLSRRAAETIVAHSRDDRISNDVSWPLLLLRRGGYTLHYLTVEGTEFETGDRYLPEISAAGGYEPWLAQLDAEPQNWATRFEMARMHAEAMVLNVAR